jgi:hypothetical protein
LQIEDCRLQTAFGLQSSNQESSIPQSIFNDQIVNPSIQAQRVMPMSLVWYRLRR